MEGLGAGLEGTHPAERRTGLQAGVAFSAWLTSTVADALRLPVRDIDPRVPLTRLGMDSLAMVEITTAIGVALDCEVPETLLLDCPSIDSLARYMGGMRGDGWTGTDEPATLRQLMLADSVLPADIDPAAARAPRAARAILLTGATGFLGAYLLRALLRSTPATVYCLLRPGTETDGRVRIRRALECWGIWSPSFDGRVEIVAGDIEQPRLGLSMAEFNGLSRSIDTIFHCAASVNWSAAYSGVRSANVLGTGEILRLAALYRRKPVHFISSVAACYSTDGPREVSETDDTLAHLDGIHLGYARSKCVAEALVRHASERGLPATIYRPSLVCGDSTTGGSNTDDLLSRLIKGCIQMGCAPDLDWVVDACPVDYVAEAIVRLAQVDAEELRVLHVTNPVPRHWRECILWMNLYGHPVRLLPYSAWLDRLAEQSDSAAHPLYALRGFFLGRPPGAGGLTLPELYEESRKSRLRCADSRRALARAGLACPPLSAPLLDRYFESYTARGFLPPVARTTTPLPEEVAIDREFFAGLLHDRNGDPVQVRAVSAPASSSEHSIISELTSWRSGRAAGLRAFTVATGSPDDGTAADFHLMVKMKPRDEDVMAVGDRLAALCGDELGRQFSRFRLRTGVSQSHARELAIYQQKDPRFTSHAPLLHGSVRDDRRHAWILVIEQLREMELMDSADDVSGWTRPHIESALQGIAEVHAIWYGRERELLAQPWLGPVLSADDMAEMTPLWTALADHADRHFTKAAGSSLRLLQQAMLADIGSWWGRLESLPRTLIHNDFNPRNVALRRVDDGLRLCAYDWELATLGVPQHDVAEFLCFVLTPPVTREGVLHFVEVHRRALDKATGQALDMDEAELAFRLSLHDLILNRFPMYAMIHRLRPQRFLDRVISTWRALYALFPHQP